MMNIYEVNRRLKQRPPFQMIERVTELTPGEAAVGLKTVSVNDPWFAGHFPGEPILPGVLIIESCAQLCSLTVEADGTSSMCCSRSISSNFSARSCPETS